MYLLLGAGVVSAALAAVSTRIAIAAAIGSAALALIAKGLFPGRPRKLASAHRLQRVRALLSLLRGGKTPYDLAAFLEAEGSPDDGKVVLSLTLEPALHNFLRSMHGGAIASAVDVSTTLAIVSAGGFPGVSTSLGATVLKLGATLAYTECRLFRGSDGALMARGWHVKHAARGWHVKHVVPPLPLSPLLSLRPALAARLLAHLAPYFGRFGEIGHDLLGWDAPLQVAAMTITTTDDDALCFAGEGAAAGGGGVASPARWRFKVGPAHVNGYGALHGGCTASVIDSLGTAAIALGEGGECGVASRNQIINESSNEQARGASDEVVWEASVLKRGGRLATVEGGRGRGKLLAVGSLTKSLRGPGASAEGAEPQSLRAGYPLNL
ncbi:hypothetical protein EMIHUDRAFT_217561 [Emiliania huxleyi CCMP1516]|uniref:Thioesterase domain-containing protein n=2 Tax=Emiliania huxleyi TaxID=2903 RepID=A0A0D3IAX0_EMIH1|nr:hypothetical protein EMIHUDRAFT_217561 [Emiliania huxleyi CCMP1516]EOD08405.1 hypothetical protein EMIHUDRAFT_217561 [Emiliania huxleyi CCMP1516]|eukprot:XP_005760834.1 hypothetical protein EMIHUDRAFT_217561 [Emiliania huxleyi CCMP1516]